MSSHSVHLAKPSSMTLWLQSVTLIWMLTELAVAAYAAWTSHSVAVLAFGSDSLVEVLSAVVVLLQWTPAISISERSAGRMAGALLYLLASIIAVLAISSFAMRLRPERSWSGIAITGAALVAMPVLARLKGREANRSQNAALAADAVQSATCAYIALITLLGLAANAIFHIAWFDPLASVVAIPLLIKEGRTARRGHLCC